jgi:hypothetical protein
VREELFQRQKLLRASSTLAKSLTWYLWGLVSISQSMESESSTMKKTLGSTLTPRKSGALDKLSGEPCKRGVTAMPSRDNSQHPIALQISRMSMFTSAR